MFSGNKELSKCSIKNQIEHNSQMQSEHAAQTHDCHTEETCARSNTFFRCRLQLPFVAFARNALNPSTVEQLTHTHTHLLRHRRCTRKGPHAHAIGFTQDSVFCCAVLVVVCVANTFKMAQPRSSEECIEKPLEAKHMLCMPLSLSLSSRLHFDRAIVLPEQLWSLRPCVCDFALSF